MKMTLTEYLARRVGFNAQASVGDGNGRVGEGGGGGGRGEETAEEMAAEERGGGSGEAE